MQTLSFKLFSSPGIITQILGLFKIEYILMISKYIGFMLVIFYQSLKHGLIKCTQLNGTLKIQITVCFCFRPLLTSLNCAY